jgi:hypothetical protein
MYPEENMTIAVDVSIDNGRRITEKWFRGI